LARRLHGSHPERRLHELSVPGSSRTDGILNYRDLTDSLVKEAQELVDVTAVKLEILGLSIETRVRQGDPRREILAEAQDWAADLIIVGSHGRTGTQRWLVGSVAEHVVRHAPCSVEVVRRTAPRGDTVQT
jgi:nucleotide-binding universal stress UspA family protein